MPPDAKIPNPLLVPLGDAALLIRYGASLSDAANRAAIAAARLLQAEPPRGAVEIVPGLVSVLVRYDPAVTGLAALSGELRLALDHPAGAEPGAARTHRIGIRFDGADLPEVAAKLGLSVTDFIGRHNSAPLRMLATGFAPGFVYCGLHDTGLDMPRRREVRPIVPAGTVLFAARQTAIAATTIRTGWNVIGSTSFQNFDSSADPPTRIAPGDQIAFEAVP